LSTTREELMTEDLFASAEPAWVRRVDSGEPDLITLLSSVRIRRNIAGFPFPLKCGKSELYDSAAVILGGIGGSPIWYGCDFRMIDSLDDASRHLLLEMNMITPQFVRGGPGRFLLRDVDGRVACMVNEEDHISISVTNPGLDLASALDTAAGMEQSMEVNMVRDAVLGYLTSNPAYVGTGMTASVMLHLPALYVLDDMPRVIDTFKRDWNNLELGRWAPLGGEPCGSFYVLSNRITLSVTPEDISRGVSQAAQALASREMFARHKIGCDRGSDINDRFWRAWGLLRHAKKLSFPEAMDAFSFVKLGSDIGALPRIDDKEWRRFIVRCQKYHLSVNSSVIMDENDEHFARAAMFRQYIEGLSSSVS
jgi:protein arginine kinase